MALFNDLFTESADSVTTENVTPDYLKDLPLAKFAEDASFLDCGSKGLVLAEAGWTDICESVNNMDVLDEATGDAVNKPGAKIKAGVGKVKEFLKKIPEYLKKIAQNIFGTINKFLTSIAAMVKSDQSNILDAETAKAGLERYKKTNGKAPKITGFMFKDNNIEAATAKFHDAIGNGSPAMKAIEAFRNEACGKGGVTHTAEDKEKSIAAVRDMLVGSEPANGPVTSKSFITDMKATYGAKNKDGVDVTPAILDTAVTTVKGGYKDGQKEARSIYKASKESINRWIKDCEDMAKYWDKKAETVQKEDTKNDYKDNAKAVELCGNTMMKCAGLMSSYTGAFCQLLHQNYASLRGALVTCVGYGKGGKAGKKVYGESDTSIFGLDLV